MAEGILRHKAALVGIQLETDSAGTSHYHKGEAPDERAIACLQSYGIDISDLRARPFVPEDFDRFDLIYAMDNENLTDILAIAERPEYMDKTDLFLHLIKPGSGKTVPDPWYGQMNGFHEVYAMLDEAGDALIKKLQSGR